MFGGKKEKFSDQNAVVATAADNGLIMITQCRPFFFSSFALHPSPHHYFFTAGRFNLKSLLITISQITLAHTSTAIR